MNVCAHRKHNTQHTHRFNSKLKNHEIIKQHELTISFDCKRQPSTAARLFKSILTNRLKNNSIERIIFNIACEVIRARYVKKYAYARKQALGWAGFFPECRWRRKSNAKNNNKTTRTRIYTWTLLKNEMETYWPTNLRLFFFVDLSVVCVRACVSVCFAKWYYYSAIIDSHNNINVFEFV